LYSSRINAFFVFSQSFSYKAFHAAHFIRGQRYVARPLALQVAAGDFALAAGHDLPTLRFAENGFLRRTASFLRQPNALSGVLAQLV
jgi:hypothetical protein